MAGDSARSEIAGLGGSRTGKASEGRIANAWGGEGDGGSGGGGGRGRGKEGGSEGRGWKGANLSFPGVSLGR